MYYTKLQIVLHKTVDKTTTDKGTTCKLQIVPHKNMCFAIHNIKSVCPLFIYRYIGLYRLTERTPGYISISVAVVLYTSPREMFLN